MLSIHLQGGPCRVRCAFCYLGQRDGAPRQMDAADLAVLDQALVALRCREVAVAISEPIAGLTGEDGPLRRIARRAAQGGRLLAFTTTLDVARSLDPADLAGVGRLNLSVDPAKGAVEIAPLKESLRQIAAKAPGAEIVLIASLSTPRFARRLLSGLLAELLALPEVRRVALNAIKPPPPWCDRRFWLQALAQIGPLLREHLDRRLFLDCYVAARILQLGGCPARADLSPGSAPGALAFRGCVYQAAPDLVARSGAELADRLQGFTPPAQCPFPII